MVLIPAQVQWVKGSGLVTAEVQITAVAPIQFLAWELPYAMDAALKKKKIEKKDLFFYLGQKTVS